MQLERANILHLGHITNISGQMKKIYVYLAVLLLSNCSKNNECILIENKKSSYAIFSQNADDAVLKSCQTLQKYLNKITGVRLPIAKNYEPDRSYILLNIDPNLEEQEIHIRVQQNNLLIISDSKEGLSNAAYEFLEQFLGCKWYTPEAEKIPNLETVKIPKNLNYRYVPPIKVRTVHSRLFYQHKNFARAHKVTTEAFPYYVPGGRVHTFERMIPQEKFYKTHPEYFALIAGKRRPTQLCLSNKTVYELVKKSVRNFFKEYPNAKVLSVSPNDNTQYCQCKKCAATDKQEGSHSGSLVRFVNKIAQNFPNKTISTLAYQYTRKPCKTKPLPNVLITLCSIECDRSAAIEEKCKDFTADLKGWSQLTQNIRIWDYTTQFTNFLAPFPNLHTLAPNIRFFKNANAKWIFEQHSHNPSDLFELRSYLMAELLWNPERKTQDIIFEFTEGYYKAAGVYIRKYIQRIQGAIKKDKKFFLFLYGGPSQAFESFLQPKRMQEYLKLFDKAIAAVKDNSVLKDRVSYAFIGVTYAFLELCRTNVTPEFSLLVQENKTAKINPAILKKLDAFEKTTKKAQITLMNEMGYKTSKYLKDYRKNLALALQPNLAKNKKVTLLTKPKKYVKENPQALTDGILGGSSFYANWLGFEGNHLEAIIDLEKIHAIKSITSRFLQVTNHIVFFPKRVVYLGSVDGKIFKNIATLNNVKPLQPKSKTNDTQIFRADFKPVKVRYVKIFAQNLLKAPYWHNASGLPCWIFVDEVFIN